MSTNFGQHPKLALVVIKLQSKYEGPFLVVEVISECLFLIVGKRKSGLVHHDKLKPCHDRNIPGWLRRKRHKLLTQGKESILKDLKTAEGNILDVEDANLAILLKDDNNQSKVKPDSCIKLTPKGDDKVCSPQPTAQVPVPQAAAAVPQTNTTTRTGRRVKANTRRRLSL